jgi:hypothetical protein
MVGRHTTGARRAKAPREALSSPGSKPAQFVYAVIRIPKSGSASLLAYTDAAFPQSNYFRIPNTLNPDASISTFQKFRYARHVVQANLRHFRAPISLHAALGRVEKLARPFDVITGGHLDFPTLSRRLSLPVKMIALVRDPATRALSDYNYARAGHARKRWFQRFDAAVAAKAAYKYSFLGYLDFLLDNKETFGDIASRYLGVEAATHIPDHLAAHAFHIGRLEELENFVAGLREKTGTRADFPHINKTTQKTATVIGFVERRKIHDLYAKDYELYEWCGRGRW